MYFTVINFNIILSQCSSVLYDGIYNINCFIFSTLDLPYITTKVDSGKNEKSEKSEAKPRKNKSKKNKGIAFDVIYYICCILSIFFIFCCHILMQHCLLQKDFYRQCDRIQSPVRRLYGCI